MKKLEAMYIIIKRFPFLVMTLFLLVCFSCSKKNGVIDEEVLKLEEKVFFEKTSLSMILEDKVLLTALFEENVIPQRQYAWHTTDPEVVSVTHDSAHQAFLIAKREGRATISYRSEDGELSAICEVTVSAPSDGIIRVLAIGNSFSEDALEQYLNGLANASGDAIIIGNLYIGGASLSKHVEEMSKADGASEYSYRKINKNGEKNVRAKTSLTWALSDEPWEYISFQQASPNSGQYETYLTPLPQLYNFVKNQLKDRVNVKYVFHQTWAYEQSSTHAGFAAYGKNQLTMYNSIIDAVNRIQSIVDFDLIIPAGTAIQNGRTSVVGDNFCRDGYHLDLSIGRYTASCVWYEKLFGKSVLENEFKPATLSPFEAEIAKHAAHFAVQRPNEITEMSDYMNWPDGSSAMGAVLVNFSRESSASGWNTFTGELAGGSLSNLQDKDGHYTGISMTTLERFGGQNTNGAKATTTPLEIPSEVTSTSFFGNSKAEFQGRVIERSVIKLEGLEKGASYSFCFFGSRTGVSDNREAAYTVKGQSNKTAYLDAANNSSQIACINNINPDDNGEILIEVTSGPNNTSREGFFYLNAMQIIKE